MNPDTRRIAIVESDHNAFSKAQKAQLKLAEGVGAGAGAGVVEEKDEDEMEIEDDAAPAGAGAGVGAAAAAAGDESSEEEEEEVDEGEETKKQFARRVGPPFPGVPGVWASCIRIFDPITVRRLACNCVRRRWTPVVAACDQALLVVRCIAPIAWWAHVLLDRAVWCS